MIKLKNKGTRTIPDGAIKKISSGEIAVVGIAARFPGAENHHEFWKNLCSGKDVIKAFPPNRIADQAFFLEAEGVKKGSRFRDGGYLERIDTFDYAFFKIPYREAVLMDPNQRLFLETAWHAVEDAGYSPGELKGSQTGVFMGYSGKSEYQTYISKISPEDIVVSEAGNIDSIIASRISYVMDLKGPSMLVDTACSSSLTAVHLACQSLQRGETDMVLVGGCKILATPIDMGYRLGIESSTGRTRTFDDSSDGTGFGEGVICMMLKPLSRAMSDHDHIYAVIKGSGVNQDGSSLGITAPNMAAQEELLVSTWEKSGVAPEKITYIETHGTGTKLGDPIEVNAINQAFGRFTGRKQFCAVGSLKSMIGHLDQSAGIAGLLKAVLSVYYGVLPPTLHFEYPNRNIDFINSAVYVNDVCREWNDQERYCGVSAFGLSGTNCHILLGNAPDALHGELDQEEVYFLLLSARNKEGLIQLAQDYHKFLQNTAEAFRNICFTAAVGREHHSCRLAILAKDKREAISKLERFLSNPETDSAGGIWYGKTRIVARIKKDLAEGEVYEEDLESRSEQAQVAMKDYFSNRETICDLYCRGANVNWGQIYRGKNIYRSSQPVYPFTKSRCWLERKKPKHPLLSEKMMGDDGQEFYRTYCSRDKHWVLEEHQIAGYSLAPGTTYIEMIYAAMKERLNIDGISMSNVIFLNPLTAKKDETVTVDLVIERDDSGYRFRITEKDDRKSIYCEGDVREIISEESPILNFQVIRDRCKKVPNGQESDLSLLEFGPRWSGIKKELITGEKEAFVQVTLPEEFLEDFKYYSLHPALLDIALNAVTQLTGHGIYLPFSYGRLRIYGSLPAVCYSYIKINGGRDKNYQTISLDVSIADSTGKVLVEAEDFIIKQFDQEYFSWEQSKKDFYHSVVWEPVMLNEMSNPPSEAAWLVLGCVETIRHKCPGNIRLITAKLLRGREGGCQKHDEDTYAVSVDQTAVHELISQILTSDVKKIIVALSDGMSDKIKEFSQLQEAVKNSMYLVKYLIRALAEHESPHKLEICLIANYVFKVNGKEPLLNPHYGACLKMGQSVEQECPNLKLRCIDMDIDTSIDVLWKYELFGQPCYCIAFRENKPYAEHIHPYQIQGQDGGLSIKDGGVYLITGGTGGIGRALAGYLGKKNRVTLILAARRGVTELEDYECEQIQDVIAEIEKSNSHIELISCDLGKEEDVKTLLGYISKKYGKLNGIFHAAGTAGNGYLFLKSDEAFATVIAPKIYGTWLLDYYSKKESLDFVIYFSSISALYGSAGQSDYTAANAYMDIFAESLQGRTGTQLLSLNWAAFGDTGMAVAHGVSDQGVFHMLDTQDAFACMERAAGEHISQLVIGKINAEYRAVLEKGIWSGTEQRKANSSLKITGRGDNCYHKTEKEIAGIWQQVLGADEIDIYVEFGDMGGNSIIATELYKEIDKRYPSVINISSIFTYPSVYEISKLIDEKMKEKESDTKYSQTFLDIILKQVEAGLMTVEEALTEIR